MAAQQMHRYEANGCRSTSLARLCDIAARRFSMGHAGCCLADRPSPVPAGLDSRRREPAPIVHHGPFVMNTSEEIRRAIEDYRTGRLGQIPAVQLSPNAPPRPGTRDDIRPTTPTEKPSS